MSICFDVLNAFYMRSWTTLGKSCFFNSQDGYPSFFPASKQHFQTWNQTTRKMLFLADFFSSPFDNNCDISLLTLRLLLREIFSLVKESFSSFDWIVGSSRWILSSISASSSSSLQLIACPDIEWTWYTLRKVSSPAESSTSSNVVSIPCPRREEQNSQETQWMEAECLLSSFLPVMIGKPPPLFLLLSLCCNT